MATTWTTQAELTFSDQDEWKSKVSGNAEDTRDFKSVAEAPEDLHLDPEDFDIAPETIQVDNESWTSVSVATLSSTAWTTINTDTD